MVRSSKLTNLGLQMFSINPIHTANMQTAIIRGNADVRPVIGGAFDTNQPKWANALESSGEVT